MRVPDTGQPLYERRIVRDGKRFAEQILAGYAVTANGRFVRDDRTGGLIGISAMMYGLASTFRRAAKNFK